MIGVRPVVIVAIMLPAALPVAVGAVAGVVGTVAGAVVVIPIALAMTLTTAVPVAGLVRPMAWAITVVAVMRPVGRTAVPIAGLMRPKAWAITVVAVARTITGVGGAAVAAGRRPVATSGTGAPGPRIAPAARLRPIALTVARVVGLLVAVALGGGAGIAAARRAVARAVAAPTAGVVASTIGLIATLLDARGPGSCRAVPRRGRVMVVRGPRRLGRRGGGGCRRIGVLRGARRRSRGGCRGLRRRLRRCWGRRSRQRRKAVVLFGGDPLHGHGRLTRRQATDGCCTTLSPCDLPQIIA